MLPRASLKSEQDFDRLAIRRSFAMKAESPATRPGLTVAELMTPPNVTCPAGRLGAHNCGASSELKQDELKQRLRQLINNRMTPPIHHHPQQRSHQI